MDEGMERGTSARGALFLQGGQAGRYWVRKSDRLPMARDGGAMGRVLAWHNVNGAMLIKWADVERAEGVDLWMPMPEEREI